jgi:hypothetical protein
MACGWLALRRCSFRSELDSDAFLTINTISDGDEVGGKVTQDTSRRRYCVDEGYREWNIYTVNSLTCVKTESSYKPRPRMQCIWSKLAT